MAVMTAAQVAAFAQQAGWTSENDIKTAVAIAYAESKFDTSAQGTNNNGTHDWGLFQINDVHKPTTAEKIQPLANTKKAFSVYKQQGWGAWATYNRGLSAAEKKQGQIGYDKIKKNPDYAKDAVKGEDGLPTDYSFNPLDAIGNKIGDATNAVTDTLFKIGINVGAVVGAFILLILGALILSRTSVGKAAKVVGKVL